VRTRIQRAHEMLRRRLSADPEVGDTWHSSALLLLTLPYSSDR